MADETKQVIDQSGVKNLVSEIKKKTDATYIAKDDETIAKKVDITITGVKVNGETVAPDVDKVVSLTVPTTSDINSAIAEAVGNIKEFDIEVVEALPTSDIKHNTIYLVPNTNPTDKNVYDEYIYLTVGEENKWELISQKNLDLSKYFTKEETEAKFVAKVEGKDLSTNDYTTADKDKLAGVEEGAQVNTITSVAGKTGDVLLAQTDITGLTDALNDKVSKSDVLTEAEIQGLVAEAWK